MPATNKVYQIVTHGDGNYSIRADRFETESNVGQIKFFSNDVMVAQFNQHSVMGVFDQAVLADNR